MIVDADVNASANIAQTKILNLTTDLAAKALGTTDHIAGAGLTGGGTLAASRTFDVVGGTGITVNANDVAVNTTVIQAKSEKGVANGYAPLDGNNLVPTVHMPPLAVNEVFVVASQAAMLALTAQRGDMAIRTDNGKTYVLSTDAPSHPRGLEGGHGHRCRGLRQRCYWGGLGHRSQHRRSTRPPPLSLQVQA